MAPVAIVDRATTTARASDFIGVSPRVGFRRLCSIGAAGGFVLGASVTPLCRLGAADLKYRLTPKSIELEALTPSQSRLPSSMSAKHQKWAWARDDLDFRSSPKSGRDSVRRLTSANGQEQTFRQRITADSRNRCKRHPRHAGVGQSVGCSRCELSSR